MPELNIINEKENPLFNRKEIQATINAKVTPNYKEVRKILSEKFSAPVETIKINSIKGKFGSKEFEIHANIYKSTSDLEATEKKSKKELEAEKQEQTPAEPERTEEEKLQEKTAEETETPKQATQEDKVEDNKKEIKESAEKTEKPITKEEEKENA